MHVSWNSTNSALQQRISETRVAKDNLDTHLAKTNQEIKDQEKEISTLTKALRDKEAPLKVTIEILNCPRYMVYFKTSYSYLRFLVDKTVFIY